MLNKLKDAILYEDFDSSDEFKSAFQKKYDKLIEMRDEFKSFSNYTEEELSNNKLEVKISDEFENFSVNLKTIIEEVESAKGGVR